MVSLGWAKHLYLLTCPLLQLSHLFGLSTVSLVPRTRPGPPGPLTSSAIPRAGAKDHTHFIPVVVKDEMYPSQNVPGAVSQGPLAVSHTKAPRAQTESLKTRKGKGGSVTESQGTSET